MSIMATEWEFRTHGEPPGIPAKTSRGTIEPREFFQGKRSSDFTDPLETWEIHRPSTRGDLSWIWRSFEPFMPPGTRHWALPTGGLLARTRTVEIGRRSEVLSSHASSTYSEKRNMIIQSQMLESEPSESSDRIVWLAYKNSKAQQVNSTLMLIASIEEVACLLISSVDN